MGGPWYLPDTSAGSWHQAAPSPQTREHLAKAQRGLPGEGVSEVIQTLVEISQDGTSYSGDLLSTIDVLRNMTEIFRRAYYSPTPGDVQVAPKRATQGRGAGKVDGGQSGTPASQNPGLDLGPTLSPGLDPGLPFNPDLAIGWALTLILDQAPKAACCLPLSDTLTDP